MPNNIAGTQLPARAWAPPSALLRSASRVRFAYAALRGPT